MIAFTDAAVAIALTLLVLPLVDIVPEAAHSGEPAVAVVTDNLAPIGSFLLSFAVIARFWSVHHRLFGYEHRLTRVAGASSTCCGCSRSRCCRSRPR